ncbi:MAG: S1-like domain-containing RNA-binding protein [Gammaproteobacteria bacterium]|nr:S1-like domain-containing RNA-binding protein [Gammaproteobacteria bacterium]
MAEIGKTELLKVLRGTESELILDGGELGELPFSIRGMAASYQSANRVEAFVYPDSAQTLAVTTQRPKAQVGEFALLKVVTVNPYGAFLDWGMERDLLVPFSEQHHEMIEGRSYIVYIYFDEVAHRITATSRIDRYLDQEPPPYFEGEKVNLLIGGQSDIGTKAIINNAHWGVLYSDEVFEKLNYGQKTTGFIKKIRDDDKIDLYLHKPGYGEVDALSQKILDHLKKMNGSMEITDKSPPEVIYEQFGVSKKKFKMAIGGLYKKRIIALEKKVIRLAK